MGLDDVPLFPPVTESPTFSNSLSDLTTHSPDLMSLGDLASSIPLFPPTSAAQVQVNFPSASNGSPASQGRRSKPDHDPDAALKRQRNTIAARKYRQKRLDRIKELEDALEEMTKERDDLRIRLARQEAETAALKEMMRSKSA
ncbi:hypothetical protein NKR23_g3501 [Pleurostoma richardsiae]|uniref:BZIP domain-containing protein n=1 Tax=Pleurostoma richardsiae TaxID=41990 RepID=A0AA38S7M8_9PEZI|nr:hypothetical protein NKR23_g3501 [Pleurostoma richardsiae]